MRRFTILSSVSLMLLLLAVLVVRCWRPQPTISPPDSTLVPVPKPTPSSSGLWAPEPESFVPGADTVVTGQVVEGLSPIQIEQSIYRDWVVKVEDYVAKPLPEATLKVRIWEQSDIIPIKGVHLKEAEHVLLFLEREDDYFTLVGGLMGGKFSIDSGRVQYSLFGYSPWEPLSEVITRVKTVAQTWASEKLTEG